MTDKDDVRAWLMSRRAKVTPQQAGIPEFGDGERRLPGLRREEVAMLADVSIDYYTKLERGDISGASESVLKAIARALQLDDVERAHLFALAETAPRVASGHRTPTEPLPASVQRVLDSMAMPAFAYNARQDLLGANLLGRALYSMHFEADQPNLARFIFLDSRARKFFADWELACSLTAAMLRYEAGRDPPDEDLTALIGELSTRSPQFRTHWADRDVHEHRTGTKGLPPSRGRRPRGDLRRAPTAWTPRTVHHDLLRAGRHALSRQALTAGQLGRQLRTLTVRSVSAAGTRPPRTHRESTRSPHPRPSA